MHIGKDCGLLMLKIAGVVCKCYSNSATLSYVQNTTLYLYICVHFVYKSLIKKLICTRDDFSFFKLKKRNIHVSLFRNIDIHLPILEIIDNRQLIAIKRMMT